MVLTEALQAGKANYRIHVSSGKDNTLPFPKYKGPDVI